MTLLVDVTSATLLLLGGALVLIASIGLLRFHTVLARTHPATKAVTVGAVLVILAAAVRIPDNGATFKLLLAALLQLVTAPIAAHMIGRAAYRANTRMREHLTVDHLGEALDGGTFGDDGSAERERSR